MLYKMGLGLTNHRRISAAALPAGPSAFTVGAWSLTDAAVGGQATVTILSLPVDGGSGLTALQYRIGSGAWTAFAGTSPGSYTVAGFVDGISTPVLVRAVNAIGSGADSDVKAVTTSAGGTVPNQTAPFGAFTLAGAGGFRPFDSVGNPVDLIAVTSPGTGTRTWSIAGGTLVADGAAAVDNGRVIVCSHAAGSVTLTIASVAGEYSVRSTAQAVSAGVDCPAAGGRTIRFRNERLILTNADQRICRNKTFTAEVLITGGPNTHVSPQVKLENAKNVRIAGFTISDETYNMSSLVMLQGACNVIVEDMVLRGAPRDPFGNYAASGSYQNPANAISSLSGTSGNPIDVTIRRCDIRDVWVGINILNTGAFTCTDNLILYTYSDCMKHSPSFGGLTALKTIARNVCGLFLGLQSDAVNPHVDVFQIGASAENGGQAVTNYVIEQNIGFTDTSLTRGNSAQGIVSFTDLGNKPIITGAVVRCNVMKFGVGNNHLTMEAVDGGVFYSNTLIGGNARISLQDGSYAQARLRGNLTEQAPLFTAAPNTDGLVIGIGGATHAYTSVFTAYDSTPGDLAGVLAAYAMKPNGPADRDNSGTGTVGDAGAIGTGAATYGLVRNASGWAVNPAYAPP